MKSYPAFVKPKKESVEVKPCKWWIWVALIVVFFFGLTGRFYDLDDAPLDFHPTRQLHSMLIARGMYYENLEGAPAWQRELAVGQRQAEGIIEPPIMERFSALLYRVVRQDDLRVPRVLSILFWTLGGIGLWLLLKDLVGGEGVVVGLAYYMVLPYALYASRAFQPEPLMTGAIIWAWWGMLKWYKQHTWKWTIIAGLLAGFAIFVKSPAVFFIAPAWLGLILTDQGLLKAIRNRQVWVLVLLTILPYALYHVYGVYIAAFLGSQFSLRFFPELWKDVFHYLQWTDMIDKTLGLEFVIIAFLGTLVIREKALRVLFLCVWLGYFLYGMVFSYHIITHDYYQIPFVPVVALGLAAGAAVLFSNIKVKRWFFYLLLSGVLFFWMAINFWDARMTLKHSVYKEEPAFWSMLGEKLQNGAVISITPDYGYRLAYWGWKTSENWMSLGDFTYRELAGQELDKASLFHETVQGKDYFLVTNFSEFDRQLDVKKVLYEGYAILDSEERYVIFDLQQPLSEAGEP